MGCCSSLPVDDDSQPGYGGRRILALKRHKWSAPAPLPTRTRLEREREEFWDTAPLYGGRQDVWQALKAACAFEDSNNGQEEDADQIQAILDAAHVTVPSSVAPELTAAAIGNTDTVDQGSTGRRGRRRNQRQDPMAHLACYDHLGNLYVIPIRILSDPSNLIEDPIGDGGGEGSSSGQGAAAPSESRGKAVARRGPEADGEVSSLLHLQQQQPQEVVRIRVSNIQKEVSLLIPGPQTTIGQIKARLREDRHVVLSSEKIVTSSLRVLFLGRILEDKERLGDISHFRVGPEGTVLQVLVSGV
ncbi:Ubiquitin domain-containing protein 2 [Linnemannia zychae]|nr:Ubiquitin domain-containing protein 2 [Linnemannia zychae]